MRFPDQIRELEERIADYERALRRFEKASGWSDPVAKEFQDRLDSMKEELGRLLAPVESDEHAASS